jgi:hypothetical protein
VANVPYVFRMAIADQPSVLALRRSRVAILSWLAEIGVRKVTEVSRRVIDEAPVGRTFDRLIDAFVRFSRWVRIAIALSFAIERGALDGEPAEAPPAKRRRIREALTERPDWERPDWEQPERERPEREERIEPYLRRPFGEVVALICRGLGVQPDWQAWSAEPWAQEEIRTRALTSPYAHWPHSLPKPPPAAEPEPGWPSARSAALPSGLRDPPPQAASP